MTHANLHAGSGFWHLRSFWVLLETKKQTEEVIPLTFRISFSSKLFIGFVSQEGEMAKEGSLCEQLFSLWPLRTGLPRMEGVAEKEPEGMRVRGDLGRSHKMIIWGRRGGVKEKEKHKTHREPHPSSFLF